MPNNNGEAILPVATAEELERAARDTEIHFRDVPRPSLTDIARELPFRDIVGYDRYVGGRVPEMNWPTIARGPERTMVRIHGDAAHDNLVLNSEELAEDQRHREVVERWRTGSATDAELARLPTGCCPCRSCLEGVFRRIATSVTLPTGYASLCFCGRCTAWRRNMALRIQDFILDRVSVPEPQVHNITVTMDTVRASEHFQALDEALTRALRPAGPRLTASAEQLRRMPPFERQRASRGHPVPTQALSPEWAPNAWEA